MKTAEGILYIIDGTVKCAEREKPEKTDYIEYPAIGESHKDYESDYESWQESCKDVVNAEMKQMTGGETYFHLNGKAFDSGQKCLFIPKGNKVRIIELK